MRTNVYYSDLGTFPNLGKTLEQKWYRITRFCKNFMEVSWNESSLGLGGVKTKNTEQLSPYIQAELFTRLGYWILS